MPGPQMEDWLRARLREGSVDDEILTKYIMGVLKDDDDPREQLTELLESACEDAALDEVGPRQILQSREWNGVWIVRECNSCVFLLNYVRGILL